MTCSTAQIEDLQSANAHGNSQATAIETRTNRVRDTETKGSKGQNRVRNWDSLFSCILDNRGSTLKHDTNKAAERQSSLKFTSVKIKPQAPIDQTSDPLRSLWQTWNRRRISLAHARLFHQLMLSF